MGAQQGWLEGHYWLAELYSKNRKLQPAAPLLGELLALWKESDPEIPVLKEVRRLQALLEQ